MPEKVMQPNGPLKPVTHVIFDMDGLLLDSENYYTIAMNNITMRYGKEFTFDVKKLLMGTTARQGAEIVIDKMKLPLKPEEFMKMADEEYLKVFPLVQMLPGVERLLDHLRNNKVPMAIASSSKRISFELKTKKFGEKFQPGYYFHHILLASDDPDVKKGKPAPDTFLICRQRFNPVPEINACLVFEDSVSGAIAGCRAGMQTVMIPDLRLDVEESMRQNPDLKPCLVLPSMLDFKPEAFGLPPFPN